MFPHIPDIVIRLFAWKFQFAGKAMLNIYFIDTPKKNKRHKKENAYKHGRPYCRMQNINVKVESQGQEHGREGMCDWVGRDWVCLVLHICGMAG